MNIGSLARPKYHFEADKLNFSLFRLTNEEYLELRPRSFPIKYDNLFQLFLVDDDGASLNLPKWLLLLELSFGCSSRNYDSWKQGFSFPFLRQVENSKSPFYYLIKIEDYKGELTFSFYRVIDNIIYADKSTDISHEPISSELSEEEIKYIICYIRGFYQGLAKSYFASAPHITPFFRHIKSVNLIYGYWEEQFVQITFDEPSDYIQFVEKLENLFGQLFISRQNSIFITQKMIHRIIA